MTNELRQLAKDLKAFAKRCKEFKYTESALFAFPLLGLTSFAETSTTDKAIQNQRQEISTSIGDMRQQFRKIKTENDKLMKDYNLELIQLMEQGDHVVKSPWSSWQYGANTILNDWKGSYKGRGDKAEKYPYEGILERSSDPYERNVSTDSKNYSLLSKTTNVKSASSNNRQGMKGYGIASTKAVKEPIVGFEVSAGIRPKTVNKSPITIAAKTANVPQLPNTISFVPPKVTLPNIEPYTPSVTLPSPPGTGNGDEQFITNGGSVAILAQQNLNGGKLEMIQNGNHFSLTATNVNATGVANGTSHTLTNNGLQNWTYQSNETPASGDDPTYAAMKLVGGHTVTLEGVDITYKGNGNHVKWLFHTDGHNPGGDSTWVIAEDTNIKLDGPKLVMYTSQYHGSAMPGANIGFVNKGNITTSSTGSDNILWYSMSAGYWGNNRSMYFDNEGTITLGGFKDIFAAIDSENDIDGFTIINNKNLNLIGSEQTGIAFKKDYPKSEILLNSPMNISGSKSTGIYFDHAIDLDGNESRTASTPANTVVVVPIPSTTRASVLNVDITGGTQNTGLYFNKSGATFDVVKSTINISNGTANNTGVAVNQGTLNYGTAAGSATAINITGGTGSAGIYSTNTGSVTTNATMTLSGTNESVGLYAKNTSGTIKNTGKISGTGLTKSMGIAAESTGTATTITNESEVDVEGTGVVGLAVKGTGATIKSEGANSKIKATGNSSAAVYSDNGTVTLKGGSVDAEGGAIDLYANNNGTINVSDSGTATAINTGQKSLAFMTANGGKINLASATTATIQGGATAPDRGTAFYYTPSGLTVTPGTASTYGSFSNLGTDLGTAFNGTLNNLTLDMKNGSRLMIASNINASLTNTTDASIRAALPGLAFTPGSTDYKTAMLYLSYLNVDKNVNLDNATDDYNKLEISNSSVENNSTMTGTQAGQVAIAQENIYNNPFNINWVTLTNNGTINLSGANSTAMYAKSGIIKNTNDITVGDSSTGIYGTDNSQISNTGVITIGSDSTGMYYDDARNSTTTTTGMTNNGTIRSAGNNSVGMSYNHIGSNATTFENAGTIELTGDKNTGMYAAGDPGYDAKNSGTIKLGNSASLNNPNVALYTNDTTNTTKLINTGTIESGANTIGIFGNKSENSGNITVGDGAIAIYSQQGNVDLTGGTIKLGGNEAVGVYTVGSGQTVTNSGTDFDIADTSYGFVNVGSGNTINSTKPNLTLGNDTVYIYSNDTSGNVTNSSHVTSTGDKNYVIYSAGNVTNTGNMDLSSGVGNVGIYSIKGGNAVNSAVISVGASDVTNNAYSIGMAGGYGTTDTGHVTNNGTINVNGDYGIGMFASGAGSTATNASNIVLNGNNTTGIYADNGATAINTGSISTGSGSYSNVVGVYLGQGSTLNNTGSITIDGSNAVGVYLKGGTIANYGNITVNGSSNPDDTVYTFTTPATGKGVGGALINAPAGATSATITINGVPQTPVTVNTFAKNPINVSASSIGLYVNTSGVDYTNSINGLGNLTSEADLIIGTEATEMTNSKSILVNDPKILNPYNNAMRSSGVSNWNIYSAGLNWLATPTLNPTDGTMTNIYMVKVPYTAWAGKENTPVNSTDTYNFLDGLEQRYGVDWYGDRGARERQLFSKLNSIGNNEEALFYQATDEMMGHQYGNVQQRINETGSLLDKEFKYLRNDWRNPSKQNNKIKVFGMRNEYNTDTAGIIDYTSNAYGVAYVHEDETLKLGNSSGWYAGAVNNRFKFKDIGGSRENQTMVKAGIFKTMSPYMDHNGSLRWTIAGDVFAGRNEMKRRFLVVDDIFGAKGSYTSYGAAFKTDLGYDIRMSERTHLRPYGALKMEYGRFNSIKEDDGEVRLEVKGNDYFSVKPEVGMEFKYVQPMAVRTQLSVGLTAAYENELGRVADGKNVARVRFTDADWFGIRGEKEDRRGSGKFDLNIGVDNTRFGVTANLGYDTKGSNIRGGIGFRAIY